MKMNKKGFTLIEMLVVIAIIAVLVSIVIPVVGNATEKAKEAADAANIRAAIAEVTTKALSGETGASVTVTFAQKGVFDTNNNADLTNISGYTLDSFANADTEAGDEIVISWSTDDECILVDGNKPTPVNS